MEQNKIRVLLPNVPTIWIDWSTKEEVKELLRNETCLLPERYIVAYADGKRRTHSRESFVYFLNSK